MKYYADGTINKLLEPLIISQNIETNRFPPCSYRYRGFLMEDFNYLI